MVVVLLACGFIVYRTVSSPSGVDQANITDLAKKIDNTKGNTPSVPPEVLRLGVSGKRPSPSH